MSEGRKGPPKGPGSKDQGGQRAQAKMGPLTASISVNCSATISGEKLRKSGLPSPRPFSSCNLSVQLEWSTAGRQQVKAVRWGHNRDQAICFDTPFRPSPHPTLNANWGIHQNNGSNDVS